MERAEGPSCPKCGCQESRLVGRARARWGKVKSAILRGEDQPESRARWSRKQIMRRCTACRTEWIVEVQHLNGARKSVPYYVMLCPSCGGSNTRVTGTELPVRHHRCDDCAYPFTSVEQKPPGPKL